MWRPEDWEKNKPPHMTIGENNAYEAGADAMLEALEKTPCDGTYYVASFVGGGKKWKCLFIPDDEG